MHGKFLLAAIVLLLSAGALLSPVISKAQESAAKALIKASANGDIFLDKFFKKLSTCGCPSRAYSCLYQILMILVCTFSLECLISHLQ